jgi:anti-anti-sigma factor
VPAGVRRSMQVALDELLANTVMHGFAGRARGELTVEGELGADRLSLTLTDDGAEFDPFGLATPDTGLSVEARGIGGLGIHLVRRMMDEVSYHRREDRNVVTVAKFFSDASVAPHPGGRFVEISTRTQKDVTIVALTGNLDSNTAPQAQQAIDAILTGGAKKMVVDFSKLDYISSAGLRVLLGAAKKLSAAGGGLHLFGLNDTVREVFEISGFATILGVFGSEAEAVRGL